MIDKPPASRRPPVVAQLMLLVIRGVLLWIVVPLGAFWWLVTWPLMHRHQVRLGQCLGWLDLNLIAAIQRSLMRPIIRSRQSWVPLAAMPTVSHRIALTDPV